MLKGEAKTAYMRDYMRRKRAKQAKPVPKVEVQCLFCGESPSANRIVVGDGVSRNICESCVAEAAEAIAAARAQRTSG
jgi:hypothetical protein